MHIITKTGHYSFSPVCKMHTPKGDVLSKLLVQSTKSHPGVSKENIANRKTLMTKQL